jgi:hypothetical protein
VCVYVLIESVSCLVASSGSIVIVIVIEPTHAGQASVVFCEKRNAGIVVITSKSC